MQRRLEQRFLAGDLDDAAEIHHGDAMADVLDHAEVVRDEQVGEAELLLQVHHQVEHLRLHRDVERRHRLVRDDHGGVERERAGNAEALALPAGELERIAPHRVGAQADLLEQFGDARLAFVCA